MASLIRYGAWLLEREPNAVRPLLCEPLQPTSARPLLSGRWLLEPAVVYALVRSAAPSSTIGALESMLALFQSAPERRAGARGRARDEAHRSLDDENHLGG
jgi:hypothetical protein